MLVKVKSAALFGLNALLIEIEIDSHKGLPGQTIVGLPDAAVKESRERVKSAIINSKFEFPEGYFTINLAPGNIRKEGPLYDLPIAIGILASSSQLAADFEKLLFIGELSLNGEIRPVSGVLPICCSAKGLGIDKIFVPFENREEAALVQDIEIIPLKTLKEAASYLNQEIEIVPHKINIDELFNHDDFEQDFSEVKGQYFAKRGLEIAASGGHNLLLSGSPGSGKTMLARRFPSILPPLSHAEALEVTKLYSITGHLKDKASLITKRPFRSPHHTTSNIGIIGGGRLPKPGEISLSHHGILFFDEFPEFEREVLEVLREPMEDGNVTIARAAGSITYPAEFLFVAAMNPCPCGNYGDQIKSCSCTPQKINKYLEKISGPLLDRIDLHIEVPRLKKEELIDKNPAEPSAIIRKRVIHARNIQKERFNSKLFSLNSRISPKYIRKFCELTADAELFFNNAITQLKMSARVHDRLLKVARTIADLDDSELIEANHIAEAAQFRGFRQ